MGSQPGESQLGSHQRQWKSMWRIAAYTAGGHTCSYVSGNPSAAATGVTATSVGRSRNAVHSARTIPSTTLIRSGWGPQIYFAA